MKRLLPVLLSLLMLLSCILPAAAAEGEPEFLFELAADGGDTKEVHTGDVITVVFTLLRTDSTENYDMYAMQNEIRYDSEFFKLVEGSGMLSSGITSTEIGLRDNYREFYMNFVSLSGGESWEANRVVGSFQLEVIAQSGITHITNQDYLVSTADGRGSYASEARDVTVILSTECTVNFQTNGGTQIDPQKIPYGETVPRPQDPIREGYKLVGWYTDLDLKTPWDFDSDTVKGNMSLFAKWEKAVPEEEADEPGDEQDDEDEDDEGGAGFRWLLILGLLFLLVLAAILAVMLLGKKTVHFETDCDFEIEDQHVKKGGYAQRPEQPRRMGRTFAGWYSDEECTRRWNFETDAVKESMTLYAKWL